MKSTPVHRPIPPRKNAENLIVNPLAHPEIDHASETSGDIFLAELAGQFTSYC